MNYYFISYFEILNKIVDDLYSTGRVKVEKLKELLGHDLIEVVVGGSIGVVVTLIAFYVYIIR